MSNAADFAAEFERVNAALASPAAAVHVQGQALPPPFPGGSAAATLPEPNELAKSTGAPTIRLAGKDWPIPLLAPRQNRLVVPAVSKVTKRMRDIAEAKLGRIAADEKADLLAQLGSDAALRKRIWEITDFSFEMAQDLEPAVFDIIADAIYWALTRAHPQLTRAQFDDLPIGMLEMIDAIGIVAQQTGMMKRADPSDGPLAPSGEA
jgi:hypothetical protein